jgi:hypothetical protein
MDTDEIVIHRVQRDRANVVLDLFRERIGEPSEAAHVHPHGEVRPLGIGRAYMVGIGIAGYFPLASADALGGAISLLASRISAVELLESKG